MATKRQSSVTGDETHQDNPAKRRLDFASSNDPVSGSGDPSAGVLEQEDNDDVQDDGGGGAGGSSYMDDVNPLSGALSSGPVAHHPPDTMIREQDRFLPIANVSRIMKRVLPESGKVAKEAKECIQECVSEFISFITSEASERCMHEKRKTINGEDILWAMQTLGFDPYVEPLKLYLSKYRLAAKGDKHGAAAASGYGGGMMVVGDDDTGAGVMKDAGNGSHSGTGGQLYLSQDDIVLRSSAEQGQVHLATGADGQLTIIEMGPGSDGHVETSDAGATAITLPVLAGSSTGENGGQQYILTALDQNAISGARVQQFTLPAGAQLAFIPASGASNTGAVSTAQSIPVVFLDPSTSDAAGNHQQSPQYITMNASGGTGLQIVHVASTPMVSSAAVGDNGGRSGDACSVGLTVSEGQ